MFPSFAIALALTSFARVSARRRERARGASGRDARASSGAEARMSARALEDIALEDVERECATESVEEGEKEGDASASETRAMCRFCFESDGALISPCACDGTAKHVHRACLRKWQRVSMSANGVDESACRVCGHAFAFDEGSLRDRAMDWFDPRAEDRARQYARVWMQMTLNTVLPNDRTVALERAGQLVPLVSCAEVRIWVGREIRKGNAALRFWARCSNACEWAHSACILAYFAASISAAGMDAISELVMQKRVLTPFDALEKSMFFCARKVFGGLIRPLRALVETTLPLHRFVAFTDRYPQYSFGEPLRFDTTSAANRQRVEFNVGGSTSLIVRR